MLDGSRARGTGRPSSDTDLGSSALRPDRAERMERLFAVLSQVTGWPDLHLVDLSRAPALLRLTQPPRHCPARGSPGRFAEFRVHAWKQMLDDESISARRPVKPRATHSSAGSDESRRRAHRPAQTRGGHQRIDKLRPVVPMTAAAWQADSDLHDATERRLQLGLEAAIDINAHILVGLGHPAPADAFLKLSRTCFRRAGSSGPARFRTRPVRRPAQPVGPPLRRLGRRAGIQGRRNLRPAFPGVCAWHRRVAQGRGRIRRVTRTSYF